MKPSIQLISALRRAADRIEAPGSDYSWGDSERCNCGQVAQQLLGSEQCHTLMYGYGQSGSWDQRERHGYCQVTGKPIWEVIKALAECGFEQGDFKDLEDLSNPTVRQRIGLPLIRRDDPGHVVIYLRAQAAMLEEQLQPPKPAVVQHPCAHMYLGGLCVYCCSSQPVETPTQKAEKWICEN